MRVTYNGPHDEVTIPLPDGSVKTVRNGGTVEVPDDVAKALSPEAFSATKKESSGKKSD